MAQSYKNIKNSASRDFKSYDTRSQLPLTGITEGTVAYVEDVRTLYVFDENAWYGIRLVNDPPVITSAPPERVVLPRGQEYAFQLEGEDPDGIPLTWSYEIIEGNTSGLNISLLGTNFSLTNNTSGKAIVIRFSANDGSNTVTSDTRFVLDDMEGLQGINFTRASTVNIPFTDADFYKSPLGFQYDPTGPITMRLHAGSGTAQHEYIESSNIIQNPADKSVGENPGFLANGRLFSIQTNGNGLTEWLNTDNNFTFSPNVFLSDVASTSSTFIYDRNCFYVENSDTVYIAGYDNNNYTSLKLYKYFVQTTPGTDWIETGAKSHQIPNVDLHDPAYLLVKGDRIIMFMNVSGGSTVDRQIVIFDKNTLEVLGQYEDAGRGASWTTPPVGSENFVFSVFSGTVLLWDISDPSNITEVTGLTWPQDASHAIYLASERLVVLSKYVSPGTGRDPTAWLYDFDSLRGTVTYTGQSVTVPNPYFTIGGNVAGVFVENVLYIGLQSSEQASGNYQGYMYRLQTTIPTPPTTVDVPSLSTAYLGIDTTFDIDGVEPGDRTITYSGSVLSGTVPAGDGVTVDSTTGEVTIRHDSESDYGYTYQYTLTDTQNETTAYTSNIVVSTRQGPGANIQNSLSTEEGYFMRNQSFLNGVSGYPSASILLGDRYFGCFNNKGWTWIDTQSTVNSGNWLTWSSASAGGVYYKSASEIYRITNYQVYKSDIANFGANNNVVFNSVDLTDSPVIENNNAGAVVREDVNNSDHLWVLGCTTGKLWKFDISNSNSWTALEVGENYLGGDVQSNTFNWGSINDNYAVYHGEIIEDGVTGWRSVNLLFRTLTDTTVRYLDFSSIFYSSTSGYSNSGYSIRFAVSRDYLFVTTGHVASNYKLTGTTDLADGRIWIFRFSSVSTTPVFLVNRYDIPGRAGSGFEVHDLSFVDGVLYAGVRADNEYVMAANFDYSQENFTSVELTRTNRGFVPRHTVGSSAVYVHNVNSGEAWAGVHRGA